MRLPGARSLRNRYRHARDQIVREVTARAEGGRSLDVLSLPSGIPRDLCEAALVLGVGRQRASFCAMDLDSEPLRLGAQFVARSGPGVAHEFSFEQGDALEVVWLFRENLFSQAEIEELGRLFRTVIENICRVPERRTAALTN